MTMGILIHLLKKLIHLFVPSLFLYHGRMRPESQQKELDSAAEVGYSTTESSPPVISISAAPGLITFLDHTLYRSYEGPLTATTCAGNALLTTYLKLKRTSAHLLQALIGDGSVLFAILSDTNPSSSSSSPQAAARFLAGLERLAKTALEYATLAIERISTDPLSITTHWVPLIHSDTTQHTAANSRSDTTTDNNLFLQQAALKFQGSHLPMLDEHGQRITWIHNTLDINNCPIINNKSNNNRQNTGRQTEGSSYNNTDSTTYCRSYSRMDCWESARLFCPDYVWADETLSTCQKLLRPILRQDMVQQYLQYGATDTAVWKIGSQICTDKEFLDSFLPLTVLVLQILVHDVPQRLFQFKRATHEVNAAVLKRMYRIKHDYRAPYRAFLESHVHVLKLLPGLDLVADYETQDWSQRKREAERKIQNVIQNPTLVQALEMEKACEELEIDMASMIFPFAELARFLDSKGGRIRMIPQVLDDYNMVPYLEELVRRLRLLLAPKMMHHASSGIRQILLDFQGVKRDFSLSKYELEPFREVKGSNPREAACERVKIFLHELTVLLSIAKIKGGFYFVDKNTEIPATLLKACESSLDVEMFQAQFEDWYDLTRRQGELVSNEAQAPDLGDMDPFEKMSEDIQRAEMELSMAMAPSQALSTVRQRLEQVDEDRNKRFKVLQEIVVDLCRREMDIRLNLTIPDKRSILRLPETHSAVGLFGVLLQSNDEILPL